MKKTKIHTHTGKEFFSRKDVVNNYDSVRFSTKAGRLYNFLEKQMLFYMLGKLPKKSKILEVGAGTGRFSIALARKGYNVIASDVSPGMQKIIKRKISNPKLKKALKGSIKVKAADAYALPFKDSEFDAVICIRVLNQLKFDEDKFKALKEMNRVVKPKGVIVTEYINALSLSFFAATCQRMIKTFSRKPYRESGLITSWRLNKMFEKLGLVKKRSRGLFILSQSLFWKLPDKLLFIHKLDKLLSRIFPFFCTRVFVKLKK